MAKEKQNVEPYWGEKLLESYSLDAAARTAERRMIMTTCRTCAYLRKCIEKATKEGYEHNVDFDASSGCPNFGFKSNTNADRIRAMSDEELAKWLIDLQTVCECCSTEERCEFVRSEDFCRQHILEWLKQPAEEEPHATQKT